MRGGLSDLSRGNISTQAGYDDTEISQKLELLRLALGNYFTKNEASELLIDKISRDELVEALTVKADKDSVYTKNEVDTALAGMLGRDETYSKTDIDTLIDGINRLLSRAYKVCGSLVCDLAVNSSVDLPENPSVGDVYNIILLNTTKEKQFIVIDGLQVGNGGNIAYTEDGWDDFGTFVDLSNYFTKEEVIELKNTLEQLINAEKAEAMTEMTNALALANDRISAEAASREAADNALRESVNAEVVARQADVLRLQSIIDENTAAIADFKSTAVYTTDPQIAGTWIDGTPIWRQAFEVTVDGNVSVNIPLCYSGGGVKLINCDCFSTSGALSSTYNRKPEISFIGGIMNVSYANDVGDSVIYGWVEFVAKESNLYSFTPYSQGDGTYKLTGNDVNNIVIPVPVEYVGSDSVQFTATIDAAEGQDIDIAYGDSTGIKLNSLVADMANEELTLINTGYPVTEDSYFMIRCHTNSDSYMTLRGIGIGVIE